MKDDLAFIQHIQDEVKFILEATKGIDFENIITSEILKRAILRSLEIIGEAAKKVSNDFKAEHPSIKWKEMAGLRDKLIHFYFGVDWNTVWNVIVVEIPELKNELNQLS
ncbi:MAG: hypothetical protein FD145_533 [Candidatus Saganbacteria bacterium]|uniref:DUF86 domain-containing protein n=1 Tax=Candidatus Saganbacteria bacterium TaxID=2575572 RepID=A0A833L1I9_UNCSA|nr:MAG: hypothetical protein FD145_533 [Candidatus Saganbacteria bacterium]